MRYPTDSFSEVVLRASWPEDPEDTVTAGAFLRWIQQRRHHFTDSEIARIEEVKQADAPPEDKWDAR